MISSPLLARQYFPRQQKFLGPPLQVNQQAYAKQTKQCRSMIKILVTLSAYLQFLGGLTSKAMEKRPGDEVEGLSGVVAFTVIG